MAVKMISNQERTTKLSSDSLFLVSEPQNSYNSIWKSKAITSKSVADAFEVQFRECNFKDDLEWLQKIIDEYLNDQNLTISYNRDTDKIQLQKDGVAFSEFDSSSFVTQGMIEDAKIKDGKLIIRFKLADGGYKDVSIDLASLIDVYYAGNGLCCENKTFRIDTDVVSIVGHKHAATDITDFESEVSGFAKTKDLKSAAYTLSDSYALSSHSHNTSEITDFEGKVSIYEKSANLKSAAYTLSSEYSLSNHNHDSVYSKLDHDHKVSSIVDFPKNVSYFTNDSGYLTSHQAYSEISAGISLNEYEKSANLKSAAYTESAMYALSGHTHGNFLSVNALDNLSIHWENAWNRVSAATDGLTGNVGSIAYKDSLSTSDINGYKDTTYTAGIGLKLNGTEFILTADVSSYSQTKANLSNDGYSLKTVFRDWISAS